jgi:protein-tyrosine phosphatase
MKIVLFLCSGNYYRSRFAEAFFNHRATQLGLSFRAESAGLRPEGFAENPGPISPHTRDALRERGIPLGVPRDPVPLGEELLARADRVVALKEAEHRPLLLSRFPGWASRVTYWNVHDVQDAEPAETIADIVTQVEALLADLGKR